MYLPIRITPKQSYAIKPKGVSNEEWDRWTHVVIPTSSICSYWPLRRLYVINSTVMKEIRKEKTGRIRVGSAAYKGALLSFENANDLTMMILKWF